jgi:hypothetical protein
MGKGRDRRKRIEKRKLAAKAPIPLPSTGDQPPPNDPSARDPEARVRSPLRPKPGLLSGAIALPEPDEEERSVSAAPPRSSGRK